MAERCIKGDYIGFTFGDVHSSELGLVRVSNGSRYEQDLLPPLQDKTAQVNGRDGAVYFGSQYNTKPIKIPVAFDNMTEESFQKLKDLLMDKKPKYLWYDETPYKQWLVKSASAQNFKWICFDESSNIERLGDGDSDGAKKRIYKGEGTLEFNCFSPYAESRILCLDDEVDYVWDWNRTESPKRLVKYWKNDSNIEKYLEGKNKQNLTLECNYNFEEWKDASRLRYKTDTNNSGETIKYNEQHGINKNELIVYNPGDKETDYKLIWYKDADADNNYFPGDKIYFLITKEEVEKVSSNKFLEIGTFKLKESDYGIVIDSKLKMIKGIDKDGKSTGNIYSKHHISGDFYKIPINRDNSSNYKYTSIFSSITAYEIELTYHYI